MAGTTRNDGAKSVGIWIRVSTEDQAQGDSPEHHERRARAYADSKGWTVTTVYHLEAVSGKTVREHPEAQRMTRDIASGAISGVIFSKLARLARNTRELLDFADFFRDHEADLVSLQESIDTSSPAGRFFYTMIAGLAQWEREEIGSRVAASVVVRAKMGKPIGGQAPYGYRIENRRLVLDPVEAPVRRLMYDLFIEHGLIRRVTRILTERGHHSRRGVPFTARSVARLLDDPVAKGTRRANYTRSVGRSSTPVLKPESEWVWQDVPALVSTEVWEQVHAIFEDRKSGPRAPRGRPATHLFTGLTFCQCGGKMAVPSNSPKYICAKCRRKIPMADLEAVFREQLRGYFLSPEEVAGHLESADEEIAARSTVLSSLEADEKRLTSEMDKLMALYLDDHLSKEAVGDRYRPLDAQRTKIRDEVPRLRGELDFLRISLASRDELVREAQDLYGHWDDLTAEEKRRVVEQLVTRITIGEGEISIDLCFQPSRAEVVAESARTPSDSSACSWTGRTGSCATRP